MTDFIYPSVSKSEGRRRRWIIPGIIVGGIAAGLWGGTINRSRSHASRGQTHQCRCNTSGPECRSDLWWFRAFGRLPETSPTTTQ